MEARMHHELGTPQDASRLAILKRADEIAEVLKAQAPADEANGTLTPETVAALENAGIFKLKLPAVLGGDEADPVTQTLALEALSNANASAGWCAMAGATTAALPGAPMPKEAIAEMFASTSRPRRST